MKNNHWQFVPVSSIAKIFLGGTPSRINKDYWGGDIKWASAKDITASDSRFIFDTEESITKAGLENSAAKLMDKDTIVITARGTVGAVVILGEPMSFNQTCYGLVANEKIFPSFLYYALKACLGDIKSLAYGTVFDTITIKTFDSLRIPLPSLPEQKSIADVLGSLDDKIELNRRMNETLQAIARAVFRQWFVVGEEVANWKIGKLGDVAENIRRSADADEIDPNTHYIGLEHMPRRSIALSEWGNASELASNKFIFEEGEFLFGKLRPYFHKVGIAPINGVCSTDILVIVPKSPEWYGFVLGHISSVELINYTNAASTGTKMPRTNWSDIANYEVVISPIERGKEFNEIFLPMAQRIKANIIESHTLSNLRNTLLPRLMKGEVRVQDL